MDDYKELDLLNKSELINELLDEGVLELISSADLRESSVKVGHLVAEDDYVPQGTVESNVDSSINRLREVSVQSTILSPIKNTQVFQIASLKIELDSNEQVIREKGYYRLTETVKYYDDNKVLKIYKHLIKIPENCEVKIGKNIIQLEISKNPFRMMDKYRKFYIEYGENLFRLNYDSYNLDMDSRNTNLFIDYRGNVTFNYNEEIAVINVINDKLKLGKFEVNLLGEDRCLVVRGKWVKLNRNIAINGIDGILKMGKNKVKMPEDCYITSTVDGANIYIKNKRAESVIQLIVIYQGDYVEFRNQSNSIRMKKSAKVVLDQNGSIYFDYEGHNSWINLKNSIMQVAETKVNLYKGESIKVTGKWVYLNEVTSINPSSRTIKYGKSKLLVQGLVELFPNIHQLEIKKKDRHIFCIPRNKQLFIRVGGKLIILTITVGIAIDQNGNLAFDHGGYLTTMDTNFMVLNIDSVKMNIFDVQGVCVEFIGNTVIVSTQDHQRNFFELLENQLSKGGIADIFAKLIQSNIDIAQLIDMILNKGDDVIKLLQEAGILLDSEMMQRLQKLLGKNILLELMTQEGNLLDQNQLMCLSLNPGDLINLILAGQNIALPSAEEIIQMVLSSGSMESILAKVKGKNIDLLTAL